jgi:chromosome partitioning protein
MARIITLSHQKGGVGKTTLALQFHGYFDSQGIKTALVDVDPQASIRRLSEKLQETEGWKSVRTVYAPDSQSILNLQNDEAEVLIIDTPPYLTSLIPVIFSVSNVVVIPCKPSPVDVLAIGATVHLVKEAQKSNPSLKSYVLLNMVKPNSLLTREILPILADYGLPVLEHVVKDRVAYQRAVLVGPSVFAMNEKAAQEEIEGVMTEILGL